MAVYNCTTTKSLIWNIKPPNRSVISDTFVDEDRNAKFLNQTEYFLTFHVIAAPAMNVSSLLIILHTSNWNGTEILCAMKDNLIGNKTQFYVIAGTH